jgi:alpha-tubulin suppressor-like RCC1 family protein
VALAACDSLTGPGPHGPWDALASGGGYTCGLTGGATYCWGGMPVSVISNSAVPVAVPDAPRFVSLTLGGDARCGLDAAGFAWCWGANTLGENGDGSFQAKLAPVPVEGGHRWRQLSASFLHVCGITLDDQAYCWGNGFRGALGNGDIDGWPTSPVPVPVAGDYRFRTVAAGAAFSCALTLDGEAYCWGANDSGQLGDGEPVHLGGSDRAVPSPVVGGHRFVSVETGYSHACGLTESGEGYCWGAGPQRGESGHWSAPVLLAGDVRWASLSAGGRHTCGITVEGETYCWGRGDHGQLGTEDTEVVFSVFAPRTPMRFVALSAGSRHTCGLTPRGRIYCWGHGEYGSLGHGRYESSLTPVRVGS